MSYRSAVLPLLLALTPLGVATAQGRPVQVQGRQDLAFGTLIAGVSVSVSRLDAAAAGQFVIRGPKDQPVTIELSLPTEMTGTGGALPLTFGAGDGGHGPDPAIASSQVFDPRAPLTTTLSSKNGAYYIWLGGTASPPIQQRPGPYTATITLTASFL